MCGSGKRDSGTNRYLDHAGGAGSGDVDDPIGEPDDIRDVPIDFRSSWKFSTASGTPPGGETGDAVADRERRAVRIGVPLSELEGLIGDESDIRRRVADFETAGSRSSVRRDPGSGRP